MIDLTTKTPLVSKQTISLATGLLVLFIVSGWWVTSNINNAWKTNEGIAQSAPQESVAAEQAIKDAQLWTIATLAVVAGELVAIGTLVFAASKSLAADNYIGRTKRCPFCAEEVRAAAQLCRYCGSDVSSTEVSPDSPE